MPKVSLLWDIPLSYHNSMDRYAWNLSRALRELAPAGWSFNDFIPRDRGLFRSIHADSSVLVKIDDYLGRFLLYPLKAKATSADMYHVVDHGYGHLVRAFSGHRVVVTCHDLITLKGGTGAIPGFSPSSTAQAKFRWIVKGLKRAAAVIAVSESTKKDLVEFLNLPPEKIFVIPNGLDGKFKRVADRAALERLRQSVEIPRDAKVILHVGNKDTYKNVAGVLRTLAILNHDFGIRVRLLRVGARLSREHRLLARELAVVDFIHELENASDAQLVLAYNLADVLLFPSWWEGFGWPPLEAMACGTPVIVSNRGSLPEVVGEAGVLREPDDYLGIAQAAKRIFEDSEWRHTLIDRGLARAARFTWERAATQTLRVYESILQKEKSS